MPKQTKQQNALISVIMCVYNTPQEYLNEAVLSVLNQTYPYFELIIVDDNSNIDLFNSSIFQDERISLIYNSENHGPSFSRNRALRVAKGKYISIMDSDDVCYPTRFEKQVAFLDENNDYVACGTWFKFIGDKQHIVKRIIDNHDYFRCCLLFDNYPTLLNSSMMIRKEILDTFELKWDERLRIGEDYFLWVQLLEHGKIKNLDEVLVEYRVHGNQATSNHNRDKYSSNTWLIQEYQFTKLGLSFKNTYSSLFHNKVNSIKKIRELDRILKSIMATNKKTHYFNQLELEKRCREEIKNSVYSMSNPLKLVFLCFTKKYSYFATSALKHKLAKLLGKKQ